MKAKIVNFKFYNGGSKDEIRPTHSATDSPSQDQNDRASNQTPAAAGPAPAVATLPGCQVEAAAEPCRVCGAFIAWWDVYGGGPHCHRCRDWPDRSLVARIAVCVAQRWLEAFPVDLLRQRSPDAILCDVAKDDSGREWEAYTVTDVRGEEWDVIRRTDAKFPPRNFALADFSNGFEER